MVVLKPEQIVLSFPAFTTGDGFTVTETVPVFVHPAEEVTSTV
jgi:hypothetical protein